MKLPQGLGLLVEFSVLIKWANEENDEIQTGPSRGRQYVCLVGNGRMDPYSSSRIFLSFIPYYHPQLGHVSGYGSGLFGTIEM